MGILADLDYALSGVMNGDRLAIYMGTGALHAFWAERCARDDIPRSCVGRKPNGTWLRAKYRDITVIPTDWPSGWEIAEAT